MSLLWGMDGKECWMLGVDIGECTGHADDGEAAM